MGDWGVEREILQKLGGMVPVYIRVVYSDLQIYNTMGTKPD